MSTPHTGLRMTIEARPRSFTPRSRCMASCGTRGSGRRRRRAPWCRRPRQGTGDAEIAVEPVVEHHAAVDLGAQLIPAAPVVGTRLHAQARRVGVGAGEVAHRRRIVGRTAPRDECAASPRTPPPRRRSTPRLVDRRSRRRSAASRTGPRRATAMVSVEDACRSSSAATGSIIDYPGRRARTVATTAMMAAHVGDERLDKRAVQVCADARRSWRRSVRPARTRRQALAPRRRRRVPPQSEPRHLRRAPCRLATVRARGRLGRPVGVLADLPGPKIRAGHFPMAASTPRRQLRRFVPGRRRATAGMIPSTTRRCSTTSTPATG